MSQPSEWPDAASSLPTRTAWVVVLAGLLLGASVTVALAYGLPSLPADPTFDRSLGLEEQTFEFTVLDEKVRATTVDLSGSVVVIGDSSALHGFDPQAFESGAHLPAVNVATFGFADTSTSLLMARRALERGRPAAILLWVHPRSLARPQSYHRAAGYMGWLDRRLACGDDDDCLSRRLDRLNQRVSGPLRLGLRGLDRPWTDTRHGMSGPAELRRLMREHGGQVPVGVFAFDATEDGPSIHFDAFATLHRLDAACSEAGVPLFVVLQPYVQGLTVSAEDVRGFAGVLASVMPSMTLVTAIPPLLPADNFEQPGHLAAQAAAAASARIGSFVGQALGTARPAP